MLGMKPPTGTVLTLEEPLPQSCHVICCLPGRVYLCESCASPERAIHSAWGRGAVEAPEGGDFGSGLEK